MNTHAILFLFLMDVCPTNFYCLSSSMVRSSCIYFYIYVLCSLIFILNCYTLAKFHNKVNREQCIKSCDVTFSVIFLSGYTSAVLSLWVIFPWKSDNPGVPNLLSNLRRECKYAYAKYTGGMPECKGDGHFEGKSGIFRRCCPHNLEWVHRKEPIIIDWVVFHYYKCENDEEVHYMNSNRDNLLFKNWFYHAFLFSYEGAIGFYMLHI